MQDIDLGKPPETTEEMLAYAAEMQKQLTAAFDEEGARALIPVLAQLSALLAFTAKTTINQLQQLGSTVEGGTDLTHRLLDLHKVQTYAVSQRLEDLEERI
ncbi:MULTISPECIES: hypothetical protein [unclassified Synechococcus]|uniref:hypothetical protein n=1 Tax=unclassified Synechococcus TaxID=2626047 RepID=UPI002001659C|nr:hypothetical protein [Synechococcus sp. A10-1-5-1]UPM49513.1 hypothetical protein MY494_09200 [Synechococcus sp. A10-1-5-1]